MRSLALVLCLLFSPLALAGVDFFVGPQSLEPNPADDDLLGFSVAASPGPGGSMIAIVGSLGGFVSVATMLPGEDQFVVGQRLTAGVGEDGYGFAVAIGGLLGSVVAVGAPFDDTLDLNSGRVYLYRRASSGMPYVLDTFINPPLPVNAGNYGVALAISEDGNRLVVGEARAQQATVEHGAVHVYDISGAIGAPQTLLGGLNEGGRFGQSVALSGNRLAVGAPLADDAAMVDSVGAVLVFEDVAGTFVADGLPLFASDRADNDRLGLSVAIDGDVLISGAGNDNKSAGADAGSAYVFRRAGTWAEEEKLRSTDAQLQERFGQSVALRGDEALVGAYCLNTSGCMGGGAVYRFERVAGCWEAGLRHAPADSGSFGHAVAYADSDTVAVGAFGTDDQFTDQGAVYALKRIDQLLEDGFEDPTPKRAKGC